IAKWPLFKAELEQTSDQWNINDVENMSRLRKCLKGDALEAVQSLMVHPDNLPEIMKTLKRRFGRPEAIIKNAIDQIKKVLPIKERHFDSVVSFACHVSNTMATIKSFGEEQYLTNLILQEEIVSKLPTSLCMSWLDYSDGSKPNLEKFSRWLNRRADVLSAGIALSAGSAYPAAKEKPPERQRGKCQVLATGELQDEGFRPSSPKVSETQCKFCMSDGHKIQVCHKFRKEPYEDRQQFSPDNRLCFGCLNVGHGFAQCRTKRTCPVPGCNKVHPEALHPTAPTRGKSQKKEEKPEPSGQL